MDAALPYEVDTRGTGFLRQTSYQLFPFLPTVIIRSANSSTNTTMYVLFSAPDAAHPYYHPASSTGWNRTHHAIGFSNFFVITRQIRTPSADISL